MSLYKDASLAMIPSAYKDGKLYSIRPTDGSGDFTFSRGSNLAATRVDVNGLIEKGRENLLLQSNQFDTTWVLSANTTITSGQSGYDGSNDAWLFTKDNTQYRALNQNSPVSGICTLSVYAKAGTLNQVTLRDGVSQGRVEFNLSDGSVDNVRTENIVAYDISSVGNEWYRCQVSFNGIAATIQFYADFGNTTAGSIYIQDAQLESGLVATDVISTGASTAQAGILEDLPRLDYSGGASCPSLLLEPSRTNLWAHSEYFGDGSGVGKIDTTITSNSSISPEGVQNASNMTITATTSRLQFDASQGAGTYTFSVYAKSDTSAAMRFRCVVDGVNEDEYFIATSNWERYDFKFTATTSVGLCQIRSGGSTSGSIDIWGFQLEQGSYPTSYIPTMGSAVTRSNDGGNLQLDDVKTNGYFGNTYTLFFEFDELDFGSASGNFNYLYDTSNATCMYVYSSTLSINTTSGEVYTNFTQGFTNASKGKFLVKYDGSSVKIFKDGSLYRTYTNPSSRWDNPKFYRLSLSSATASISYKQFLTFPTALTDSECIALTTI